MLLPFDAPAFPGQAARVRLRQLGLLWLNCHGFVAYLKGTLLCLNTKHA